MEVFRNCAVTMTPPFGFAAAEFAGATPGGATHQVGALDDLDDVAHLDVVALRVESERGPRVLLLRHRRVLPLAHLRADHRSI